MEKIVLILLAAGDSRRFNGNKLLHLFDGKPMYRYLVDEIGKLPETLFEKKIVVTQYQEIMDALGGIRAAEAWGDCGFCFAVCDQPYLKGETVRTLVDGFLRSGKGIGCLSCQGELGNPAVFSNRYREELLALEGDVGGRRIIRRHPDDLFLCEVEDGRELVDVDVKKG